MKTKALIFTILTLLLIVSCKEKSGKSFKKDNSLYNGTITGVIKIIGNEPHTHTVISVTDEKNKKKIDYYVVGKQKSRLANMMYRKIQATGLIAKHKMKYAGKKLNKSFLRYTIDIEHYVMIQ